MTKKLCVFTIICVLILCSIYVDAESLPLIYCEDIECSQGETVALAIKIKDNPGLSAFVVGVATDSEWIYFDDEPIQGGFTDRGTIVSSCNTKQINVMWYDVDEVNSDGTLFFVTAHVSPSAPEGDYSIQIAYSPENTIDGDCNTVEFETVNGKLNVHHVDEKMQFDNSLEQDKAPKNEKTGWILPVPLVAVIAVLIIVLLVQKRRVRKEQQ